MKAYVAISFSKRKNFDSLINTIKKTLSENKINTFVFVDHYSFNLNEEKLMMQTAMNEIKSSQILIAETSHKGIGIGIEVGFAKALQIPIIYIRNNKAEHSTTVSGISDYQIIYINEKDLENKLQLILKQIN